MPPDVERAIAALLASQKEFASRDLVERTGLSRQALHRHLARALEEGRLERVGAGRSTRYRAARGPAFDRSYVTDGLREDEVSRELDAWLDGRGVHRSEAAHATLAQAVTQLFDNAIDHSGAATVRVRARVESSRLRVRVEDEGVGAFENLRARLGLEDHLRALQEINKGKATSQPDRHAGEGLFFTSKMVERFELTANGLTWTVDDTLSDQTVGEAPARAGTQVEILVPLDATTDPAEVFARYTTDLEFDRTRCVVRLFERGDAFVSRSEAKRLLARLDRFREVILDFEGVRRVGQGFVDEVFRVWARDHPEVRLIPRNMAPPVEFMVRRGLAAREGRRAGSDDATD